MEQKGSFVSPDTLRFDFSHFQKVTDEEIRQVERMVNEMIREDIQLDEHRDVPFEEAKKLGAIALFGEKYGDKVRVVRFGPSCEFCGGIHAKATGKIGFFKIISESSVAAGIRRIEAKTGKECEELLYKTEDILKAVKGLYIEEHDSMKKDIEQFQAQRVQSLAQELVSKARLVNGVKVMTAQLPIAPDAAKDLVFKVRELCQESFVCVVGSVFAEKPMLNVMLSDDMVKDHGLNAPHFASAGGKNAEGLSAAIDKVVELCNL